jgi:hypothetical protein
MPLPKKEASGGDTPAQEQPGSFRERKAAQLSEERGAPAQAAPAATEESEDQTLLIDGGSTEVVDQTLEKVDAEAASDDIVDGGEDLTETPEAQDDGIPAGDESWEKRYKDLQAEYTRLTQNREQVEQEQAETASEHLRLRFELEDRLDEAVQRAKFLKNTMEGNAGRFKNIDWSRVPPDQVQAVQAQAQQAFALQQRAAQAFEQVQAEAKEIRDQSKAREAAIAKARLSRTIPNWSPETYTELRDFAVKSGMPAAAFNQITDPTVIEWAYTAMQTKAATSKGVADLTKPRKARAPARRSAMKPQARNDRGQFAKKQVTPNERGSFADKHRHRLAAERTGR